MNLSALYWIWLAEHCGPATETAALIYEKMGNIETIFRAGENEYRALGCLKDSVITSLCDKSLNRAQTILEICARKNIGILSLDSPLYPARLLRIPNPPAVLYYRGLLPDFNSNLTLSIVGTRGMTDEGRIITYRLSYELSVCGAIIVSGMALGTDGVAQQAAMDASGFSVAVLGCAIDQCYPAEHRPMYEQLMLHGTVFSEYAPGAMTQRWNFPQRNRIISGLSQGTIVTEAGDKSGALITAKKAIEQGRDIFAVPGDPNNPARKGTNLLIKNGAKPVTASMDILSVYDGLYPTLFPQNLYQNAYFAAFDDRLRYAQDRVAEYRREESAPLRLRRDENPPKPPKKRTAPEQLPVKEERYTENAETLSENMLPTPEIPQKKPTPPKKETVTPEKAPEPAAIKAAASKQLPDDLSAQERLVLSFIEAHKDFDEICAAGIDAGSLMTDLTILELRGFIRALPGGNYELL